SNRPHMWWSDHCRTDRRRLWLLHRAPKCRELYNDTRTMLRATFFKNLVTGVAAPVVAVLLTASIFLLDTFSPLEFSVAVLYVVVVLIVDTWRRGGPGRLTR